MSDDPIKDLENFNQQGLTVNPLPASEVRRRGNRMRRRNTALAVVGAAAAVAVIATPLAVIANGRDQSGPVVTNPSTLTPSPDITADTTPPGPVQGGWLGQIPEDFDLTVGYPAENEDGSPVRTTAEPGVGALQLCGQEIWSPAGAIDRAGASYQAPEDIRGRTVALYGSDTLAREALADAGSLAEQCSSETIGGTEQVYTQIDFTEGDESFAFTQRYRGEAGFDTGLTVHHFVRVGNALLVSTTYGEGGGSAQGIAQAIARAADETQRVVDEMAVFAGAQPGIDPSSSAPTGQPAGTIEIPDGFPLADGLPDGSPEPGQPGLRGPNRNLEPLSFSACGSSLDAPPHVDQLRASWTNVEDYRERQLTTFEDAAQAVAFVQGLTDFYRSCPEEDLDQAGYTVLHEVTRTAVGGESWAVVTYYEFDGAPAVGLGVVHVIRLGRAVLIDTTANEGGAGPDRSAQIQAQIQEQTNATVEVVSAMCLFTEAGC